MDTPTTVTDVLRSGLTILRSGGMCKGQYKDEQGRHCALGAIAEACGLEIYMPSLAAPQGHVTPVPEPYLAAERVLDAVLMADQGYPFGHTPSFNDQLDTELIDVESVYELAIQVAESAGL